MANKTPYRRFLINTLKNLALLKGIFKVLVRGAWDGARSGVTRGATSSRGDLVPPEVAPVSACHPVSQMALVNLLMSRGAQLFRRLAIGNQRPEADSGDSYN